MQETLKWVLTDTPSRLWVETFAVDAAGCGAEGEWSLRKHALRGGPSAGVDLVEVDNGALSFCLLPTRGMGLWRGAYHGLPIGWNSPVRGPVHPGFVNLQDRGGLGFLTGFDEAIVRCGLNNTGSPCTDVVPNNMGVPTEVALTLHGRIANLPATRVEVAVVPGTPPVLQVTGTVYETGLFYPGYRLVSCVSTAVGSNRLTIQDQVTNLGGVPAEMELLYHCNFGAPFLDNGARLVAAARQVAPRDARAVEGMAAYDTYLGPTPGYVEQVYWYDLLTDASGRTVTMLRNAAGDRGLALRFDKRQLPAFAQWKNTAAASDGYVTGLEPATDLPNAKPFERERGRLVKMAPGSTYTAQLTLEAHDTADGVRKVEQEIATLQGQAARLVHKSPIGAYSPGV
jgi:hypothetical protein